MSEIATTTDETVIARTGDLFAASTAEVKGRAADALAALGSYEAVANLLRLAALQTGADDRAIILEGLGNLHTDEGFDTLASALAATRHPQIVEAAVAHLSRAASPGLLDTLVTLYRERNDAPFQKNQVLLAIRGLKNPECRRSLAKLLSTAPEPALVAAAAAALGTMPLPFDAE